MNVETDIVLPDVWRVKIEHEDASICVYSDGETDVWRLPPYESIFGSTYPAFQVRFGVGTSPGELFEVRQLGEMVSDLQD